MSGKFWLQGWQDGLRQIRMNMAKPTVKKEAERIAFNTNSEGGVEVDIFPWTGSYQIGYTIMARMSLEKGGLEWRTKPGGAHYLKATKDNPLQKALRAKGL